MRRALALIPLAGVCLALTGCGSPFHVHVGVSAQTQKLLYAQTLSLMTAERDYAQRNDGLYAHGVFDLISDYPNLAALDGDASPVVDFEVSWDRHGYRFELADQDSGGAASFTVLMPADNTPQFTCQGPAPACRATGTFTAPRVDYQLQANTAPTPGTRPGRLTARVR